MAVQTEIVYGEPTAPLTSNEELAAAAAWWLLTDEASPADVTRFVHGGAGTVQQREVIAAQVQRILDAAQARGIGGELSEILAGLFHE